MTLAVPVGQVRRRGDHGGGQPRRRPEDRLPDRGRPGRLRLRGGLPRTSWSPIRTAGCCAQKRDLSALAQVKSARAERSGPAGDVPVAVVADGLGGGRVLAAHAAIAPLGWLVFVERPAADAYAPLRAPIIRSVVIFVLGLGLSILASILLARRMVAPIRVLQEGAARIGAGDLGHRIEVRTGDELEALGDELNRTAGQLEESYASLERKVEARTRELADANAGPDRDPGAADGDERDPARHQPARRPTSSRCFDTIVAERRAPVRGRTARSSRIRWQARHTSRPSQLHAGSARGAPTGAFPMPPDRRIDVRARDPRRGPSSTSRTSLADPEYAQHVGRAGGFRASLAVPMLREGSPIGAIVVIRAQPGPFSDDADRAAQDLRRPGGHRHRERPPVQGAGGAQPRPDRDAGAADGDRRDPARHHPARRPTSSRSSTRSCRAPRGCATADSAPSSASTASCSSFAAHRATAARRRRGRAASVSRCRPIEGMRPAARVLSGRRRPHSGRPRRTPSYALEQVAQTLGYPQRRSPCRCCATGHPIGAITSRGRDGRAVLRRPDRAAQDLRRPGRHRHRERPAVQGAGGAQPRPHRDAGAADGHRRDPARHHPARRPTSSRCSTPSPRAPRGSAAPSSPRSSDSMGELLHFAAHHGLTPEGLEAVRRAFPTAADRGSRCRAGPILTVAVAHIPDVRADPDYAHGAGRGGRDFRSIVAVPMLRDGRPDRSDHCLALATPGSSPTGRSSSSRPSPTRRSSPSRTSGCSRSSRRGTATSPRRSSSRRRPARSCGSSPARRPTSSRSSTRSPRTRVRLCDAEFSARPHASTAS